MPGYEAKLLDDDDRRGRPSADTPGYLHVRGPVDRDRLLEPRRDATQAAFRGEWLRTGDVYTRSDDGYWTFLGRNSDMIKAGGIWVSPAEVESVLVEHPDVLEAAVVGARNEPGLEIDRRLRRRRGRATRSTPPRSTPTAASGWPRSSARGGSSSWTQLPKTATGKIQRFALRAQLVDPA